MASGPGLARSSSRAGTGWPARWATSPPTLHCGRALGWSQAAATPSRDTTATTWSTAARNAGRRSRPPTGVGVGSRSGIVALPWCGVVAGWFQPGPVRLLRPHLLALGAVGAEVAPRAERRGAWTEAGRLDTHLLELRVGAPEVGRDRLGLGDLAGERLVGVLVR